MPRRLALSALASTLTLSAGSGTVTLRGQAFQAEVAVTDAEKARGLMYRDSLAPDACMFFVYEEEGFHAIWMKNCRISLDVAWVDAQGRIVELVPDVPPPSPMRLYRSDADYPNYGGTASSRHFVEFPVGTFKRLGVKKGDQLGWDLRLADGTSLKGGAPVGKASRSTTAKKRP